MSKNFELLMEIEKTFDKVSPEPDRNEEPASLPSPTSSASVGFSDGDADVAPLIQRVFLSPAGAALRQVVFCGIEAVNPSSSVCVRTARSLAAHTIEKVCLVNANPSRSDLTRLFGKSPEVVGNAANGAQCMPVTSNLWLAKWNRTNGRGERSNTELHGMLSQLRHDFGYVLIDAPGCALNDDAAVLGQASDAVILVIEAETTHRQAASKAKQYLEAAGVHLIGTVLNNRSFPVPKALYERL